MFWGLMGQKWKSLEGVNPVTKTNMAFYEWSYQESKAVVVGWSGAAVLTSEWLAVFDGTMNSVLFQKIVNMNVQPLSLYLN